MDFERSCISNMVETIEQLKSLQMDDPVDVLMLAAGQHGLDVRFENLCDSKDTFICSIQVGKLFGRNDVIGFGTTKKDAKRNSAQEAILELTARLNDLNTSRVPVGSSSHNNHSIADDDDDDGDHDEMNLYQPHLPHLVPTTSSRSQPRANSTNHQEFQSRWLNDLFNDKPASVLEGPRPSNTRQNISNFPQTPTRDNPIGELQELADTYRWDKPEYKEVDEYGEDHKKTFVIQCMFKNMKVDGIATTKKAAKKKAAEEMLAMIHGQNGTPSNSTRNSSPKHSSATLHNNDTLQKDYLKKLKTIENQLQVSSEFYDLGDGYRGNCLCFVRINTDPVTVCHGSGITKHLAHNDAARNALKILATALNS